MSILNEAKQASMADKDANKYLKKYRSQIECLESHSLLAKCRGVTPFDIQALGQTLDQQLAAQAMYEEDGSLSALGKIPNIALDVLTVQYGNMPMSVIASMQPIQEETGIVWFKDYVAQDTRGNVTAGDAVMKVDGIEDTFPRDYAIDGVSESPGSTAAATFVYNLNATEFPIRPYKFEVLISNLGLRGFDDGEGVINGNGIFGTINYTTGAVTITLAADPGGVETITFNYQKDLELAPDLVKNIAKYRNKQVTADIWALKTTFGLLESFAINKRFGNFSEDELAQDLVSALNMEQMHKAITILLANLQGNTNFTVAAPAGISQRDHDLSFLRTLREAEAVMIGNAGRGTVTTMIAGLDVCTLIAQQSSFRQIADANSIGPHIFGTVEGITVVRVPNLNVLAVNEAICLYKGRTPFEAPLVHSVYMPLVVTNTIPLSPNPLSNQKAAAVWAAQESLIPNFATKITLV